MCRCRGSHQPCADAAARPLPPCPAASGAAPTPLPSQVQVKQHVRLVLERLLHPVTRRVIVLDRENTLRVSAATTALRRAPGLLPARDGAAAAGVAEGLWCPGLQPRVPLPARDVRGLDAAGCGREGEPRREQLWSTGGHWDEQAAPEGLEAPFGKQRRASGCAL